MKLLSFTLIQWHDDNKVGLKLWIKLKLIIIFIIYKFKCYYYLSVTLLDSSNLSLEYYMSLSWLFTFNKPDVNIFPFSDHDRCSSLLGDISGTRSFFLSFSIQKPARLTNIHIQAYLLDNSRLVRPLSFVLAIQDKRDTRIN